jgi:hypothetical protein
MIIKNVLSSTTINDTSVMLKSSGGTCIILTSYYTESVLCTQT